MFDRSWYGRVLVERVENFIGKREWESAYQDIVEFEQTLADDGYLIVKFWLHISQKEQKKRFKALQQDSLTAWKVTAEDWEHQRKYAEYVVAVEEMLERTSTEWGTWTIVEATQKRYTIVKLYRTLIAALEERLGLTPSPLFRNDKTVSGEGESAACD